MANETLSREIAKFFKSHTTNPEVVKLAIKIQSQIELGSTAIDSKELLDDELISSDGNSGYIVQRQGLAGFRRFYKQEQAIKTDFMSINDKPIDKAALKSAIKKVIQILNLTVPDSLDLQWQACLSCLHKSRYLLTGGPGTGKTTAVIRMMLLYLTLDNSKKIALSAPTGKAANQMMHSIANQLVNTKISDDIHKNLSVKAQTIHRLLGFNNQTNKIKYNKHNPLPYDLIIVDESSMLDVTLTYALLQALKPQAQLLLIGDKNQLPAVEAGNVFADLCELLNEQKNHDKFNLLTESLNEKDLSQTLSNYTELTKNYRFSDHSLIAQMCSALSKQQPSILNSLQEKKLLDWSNPLTKAEKTKSLENWYEKFETNETTVLLSPINNGPNSVSELNEIAREILYQNNYMHQNMPIMVTQNDYALGVFNGDIGYLHLIDNQWRAELVIEGEKKYIQLKALPAWQQANAITIHKSQGSEYDHVLITLPNDPELNILTNALLYTAISRAKSSVTLWSNGEIIEKIIKTRENRLTFLKNTN